MLDGAGAGGAGGPVDEPHPGGEDDGGGEDQPGDGVPAPARPAVRCGVHVCDVVPVARPLHPGADGQQNWVRPTGGTSVAGAPRGGRLLAVYACLDDGPHRGETLRIEPEGSGRPPRTIELADPGSGPGALVTYVLLGPHANPEWWIYRLSVPASPSA